jgi:elongator complex protein 1
LQCQQVEIPGEASSPSEYLFVGFGFSGKLYITSLDTHCVLATNATSFTIASGFIIFTTTAHEAKFIPVTALPELLNTGESNKPLGIDWEKRRVERGSRIVVSVPSSMSLVLQMPRGNLETINPRPMVMKVVQQDIDA